MIKILRYFTFALILFNFLPAQVNKNSLKETALSHMNAGRYGEAIDILNKYIASNPRNPEGYNLRGLCYEKREQFLNASSDLRIARKLAPENTEYRRNYARILETWHKLLYQTIEGRKREIAINAAKAENYLEIGKAYRGLEDWPEAEIWYDEYVKRDDLASPDEIIRYTEILMMTKNLAKGEKILKKYVERHPDDWRLWSRYGYFTLWQGKYKIAEDAFVKALEFKPFFKEAVDGLDLARRQGYIQPYTGGGDKKGKVFLIDKYYAMLKRNPDDDKTRFLLVDELIKYKRIEEAYKELQILKDRFEEDKKFQSKWEYITDYRDKEYKKAITENEARLRKNPSDKKALIKVLDYYGYLEMFEEAVNAIEKYYAAAKNDDDPVLLYKYAQYSAWNGDNEKAAGVTDKLLEISPENTDYQFFRAQLSIWMNRDLDKAEMYLENYIQKFPNSIEVLILLSNVKMSLYKLDEANLLIEKIKELQADEYEIENLESNFEIAKMKFEEDRTFGILQQGREHVLQQECQEALPFYIDYIELAGADSSLKKELGDVYFCAKEYNKALSVYDSLLSAGYNYDVAMQRGKVLFEKGDSLNAVAAFKNVVEREPKDFEANLYLGDSYTKTRDYDFAEAIYDSLLTGDIDTAQTRLVMLRKSWLPKQTSLALFGSFPIYAGLAPSFLFYSDNINFRLFKAGARLEAGINQYIALGVSFYQSIIKYSSAKQNFSTITGHVFIRPSQTFTLGFGFGGITSSQTSAKTEVEAFARYNAEGKFSIQGTYQRTAASLMMYSGNLINTDYSGDMLKLEMEYLHKTGLILSGYFKYIKLTDELKNEGNDLLLRIGKRFEDDIYRIGYEYFYSNYKINTLLHYGKQLYYSPQNFESHCIWGEWVIEREKEYEIKLNGKAGYVPVSEFLIREAGVDMKYQVESNLNFNGKITLGSTSRDNSSYNFVSGTLALYWNF